MAALTILERRFLGEHVEASFTFKTVSKDRSIRAFAYKPAGFHAAMPVIVVMHGVTREASHYLDGWSRLAEHRKFLLVVPEFSKNDWPGSRIYNLGNTHSRSGLPRPQAAWSFTALDAMLELLLPELGSSAHRFALYGHSAGAQFVHRYAMFTGGRRLTAAVAANAGWYMLPDQNLPFPYGISNVPQVNQQMKHALSIPMTILLGQDDICTNDPNLRRTQEALKQGANRLQRGRHFYASAQAHSLAHGLPFNWRLREIDGAGHNDRHIAPIALDAMQCGFHASHARGPRCPTAHTRLPYQNPHWDQLRQPDRT